MPGAGVADEHAGGNGAHPRPRLIGPAFSDRFQVLTAIYIAEKQNDGIWGSKG